jgi:hypothetical protein
MAGEERGKIALVAGDGPGIPNSARIHGYFPGGKTTLRRPG